MPKTSVIIPVFNDANRLALCLQALDAQTLARDSFEVLVVDNGSAEPPHELLKQYPGWKLLEESKPGSYAARNNALQEAEGALLVFTDADCIPEPDWLEKIVDRLDAEPEVDCFGGAIAIFPADEKRPNSVELYDGIFGMPQDTAVTECHFAATANMATRRSVIDRIGPFDEELKSGGDVEWGQRLAKHGLSIAYAPEAIVRHPARSKFNDLVRQARRHSGGRHDMKREGGYSYFSLHFVWAASRLLFPRPSNLMRIARHPSVTNPIRWLRVVVVMMLIRYAQVFERIRLLIGGAVERR